MNERSKIFSVTITPRGIVAYFAHLFKKSKGLKGVLSDGRTFIMLGEYRQGQSSSELLRISRTVF